MAATGGELSTDSIVSCVSFIQSAVVFLGAKWWGSAHAGSGADLVVTVQAPSSLN